MRGGRLRAGLRGWGGVGAMALVCALALLFALLLPSLHRGADDRGAGPDGAARTGTQGSPARAGQECRDPEKQTLAPSGDDGPAVERIKNREGGKRRLVVGVDQNSYHWGYRDPNGGDAAPVGFDIDLVRRIAGDILGDPDAVQFKAIPTDQRVRAIQDGRVDMVVRTMTITCARLADVAFSAPYFRTGQQVLVPASSPVTGYDASLAGRRVCTASGSTAHATLERDRERGTLPAGVDFSTTVANQLDCLVRLQLGEVDAIVTDGALAAGQAAQDPTVRIKGDAFTTEFYGVAMRKDADDLVRRVNRVLVEYRADTAGGWQAAYDRWLAPTLGRDASKSAPPDPKYLRTG